MNFKQTIIVYIIFGIINPLVSIAQENKPIEIYSNFKPSISRDIQKQPFTPNTIRFVNLKIDSMTYKIDTSCEQYKIKPVEMKIIESLPKDSVAFRNYQYIKGGYGMYNTPYLFGHFSFIDTKQVGLYALGEFTGMFTKRDYQNFLNFNLGTELWMEGNNKIRFFTKINYEASTYKPNKSFLGASDTTAIKTLNRNYFDVSLGFETRKDTNNQYNIRPIIGYRGITTDSVKREQTFYAEAPFLWNINRSWQVGLKSYVGIFNYTNDVNGLENIQINNFSLTPYGSYTDTILSISVGVPMYFFDGKFNIYPQLSLTIPISRKYNTFLFANVKGERYIQSYYALTQKSPWLYQNLNNFVASKVVYEAGVDQTFFSNLNIKLQIAYQRDKNLALFLNNYKFQNFISVNYESQIDRFVTTLGFNYPIKNLLRIGVDMSFTNILSQKTFNRPYSIPLGNIKGYAVYQPLKNLFFNFALDGWYGIYYQNIRGEAKQLPIALNLNAEGVYKITPNIMIWLMLKNILNNPLASFYTYDDPGIRIQGGFIFYFPIFKNQSN